MKTEMGPLITSHYMIHFSRTPNKMKTIDNNDQEFQLTHSAKK